jgi:DNA gyrase subunit B
VATDYDAKDIQVLEGLDPVRKRPGMYVGSTGLAGLHHLIWEVVDNAVDEAMAGYCTRIDVTLQADGGCRVDDNGRGIPVDAYPSGPHKGKSAVEVVLTVLHAGGKFGGTGYKVSGGLHGVGVSVVNALSERFIVEIDRDGTRYHQEYAKGGKPQGRLQAVGDTPKAGRFRRTSGTTVTFWPDPTIFAAEGTEFVSRTVLERLQTMAFLNKGLEIVFTSTARRSRCSRRSARSRTTTVRVVRRSTSRSSGTPATTRASTATPTASPRSRAGCTSRASRPRSRRSSTSTRGRRTS